MVDGTQCVCEQHSTCKTPIIHDQPTVLVWSRAPHLPSHAEFANISMKTDLNTPCIGYPAQLAISLREEPINCPKVYALVMCCLILSIVFVYSLSFLSIVYSHNTVRKNNLLTLATDHYFDTTDYN